MKDGDYMFLSHHGIKQMRWGVRRYQYEDGSLTPLGKRRYLDGKNADKRAESGGGAKQTETDEEKTENTKTDENRPHVFQGIHDRDRAKGNPTAMSQALQGKTLNSGKQVVSSLQNTAIRTVSNVSVQKGKDYIDSLFKQNARQTV